MTTLFPYRVIGDGHAMIVKAPSLERARHEVEEAYPGWCFSIKLLKPEVKRWAKLARNKRRKERSAANIRSE